MSIRLKVFLIISAIVLVISASSVIISISSAQNQILKTLESDMERLVAGASEYMWNRVDTLKKDAAAVAQALRGRPVYEAQLYILPEQVAAYDFRAIAIYNETGGIDASYGMGISPPPESIARGVVGMLAFEGERVITSSYQDTSGQVVFYIFVPMDDYKLMGIRGERPAHPQIIGMTIPGDYFSEQLLRFQPESGGHIFMVDNQGKTVADVANDWVERQVNFIELAETDGRFKDVARVIQRMISVYGEEVDVRNVDRYALKDVAEPWQPIDDIIAFKPINTVEGWSIAASSSIGDSPFKDVWLMIALSGLIFFGLGVLAAALASGVIAKPFKIAEALAKAKTAFIANMSHDLRTPLNAVIGFSDLGLSKKELPSDVRGYLKKTEESGQTILGVVNDLLDISNIESGKFGVISADYDLPNFILDTANSNLHRIGGKPVKLKISADDKLPARLNGDALRVRQVFNNLLTNAFTHTKEGTVEWKIATEKNGDQEYLVSSVSDTGVGVKEEELDKLFLDYSSMDLQKRRSFQETGMGLPLTKKILDLMGGTISAESTYGKGSVFTVRLPQKHVKDETMSAELAGKLKSFENIVQQPVNLANLQRVQLPDARVLVVDDAEINLDVARGMIEPYGITVDCVLSTHEAVELVRKGQPAYNAIFLNRWMPEMDGTEAVRLIRNEIGTNYAKSVPIIALTANAVIGNNAFFLKAGFQDVISKPLDILRMDTAIREWVAGEKR